MLTDFIQSGQAYASSLDATTGKAVQLVLVAMQKLASSSVAAIRRALRADCEDRGRQGAIGRTARPARDKTSSDWRSTPITRSTKSKAT